MVFGALLLSAGEQHGQVKFGGLGVPGASVTVTQGAVTQTAITDQQGVYTFPDLADGTWNFQVEMLCFVPVKQDVSIAAGLPAPDWDLKLLPLSEIQAAAGPAMAPSGPAAPQQGPVTAQTRNAKGKRGEAAAASGQAGFQRTDVNASAAAGPPPPDSFAGQSATDLSQRASDGFLINGSQNNGASSPFAQSNAFGNNRRGGGLYIPAI